MNMHRAIEEPAHSACRRLISRLIKGKRFQICVPLLRVTRAMGAHGCGVPTQLTTRGDK